LSNSRRSSGCSKLFDWFGISASFVSLPARGAMLIQAASRSRAYLSGETTTRQRPTGKATQVQPERFVRGADDKQANQAVCAV
jgi:hypothetical protein